MADRDGTALGVDDVGVDLPEVHARQGLHGERLVELDRGDVGPGDARAGQGLVDRLDRRDPEVLRDEREGAATGDAGERVDADRVAGGLGAEQHRRGAVVERRGVGRRDGAVRTERRLEAGQLLRRGAGADALVPGQVDAFHGHDQVVVEAVGPRRVGEVVGAGGELVLPLPRDAEPVGQLLVGLAERDGPLGRHPLVHEPPAQRRRDRGDVAGRVGARRLGQHPRGAGHRLDAAGEHDVGVARLDGPRTRHRGVERRAAEPVHGDGRHRGRQPGQQHGHPADVAVVLTGPVGVAPDDVADPLGVEVGRLRQHAGDRGGGQVVGAYVGQRAAEPPERRPRGGVHEGGGHWSSSSRTCWAIRKALLAAGTPQ